MAGGLASSFYLIGTILTYHLTGTLNIDGMVETRVLLDNPLGATALAFLIGAVLIDIWVRQANIFGTLRSLMAKPKPPAKLRPPEAANV